MKRKGWILGEMFLKEGLTDEVVKYSQELDITVVEQQRILLNQYLNNNKKNQDISYK